MTIGFNCFDASEPVKCVGCEKIVVTLLDAGEEVTNTVVYKYSYRCPECGYQGILVDLDSGRYLDRKGRYKKPGFPVLVKEHTIIHGRPVFGISA